MVSMQESVKAAMQILNQLIPGAIGGSFLLEEIESVPVEDKLGWQITISFAIPNPNPEVPSQILAAFRNDFIRKMKIIVIDGEGNFVSMKDKITWIREVLMKPTNQVPIHQRA